MKAALTLLGMIVALAGLFFQAQGLGYIPWPPSSFMVNDPRWIYYGGAIAVVGLVIIVLARRLKSR